MDTIRGFFGFDNEQRKGLGYKYTRDPRSDAFLLAPRVQALPDPPPEKEWALGPTLDQGRQGSCVGHGWAHWISASDVNGPSPRTVDHAYAIDIYNWAQNHDEWTDTPPEEGTSVLAGAKACVNFGHLKEGYLWGKTLDELIRWLGNVGPVVMGSLWLSGMNPDGNGFTPITGTIDGGHCYLCYGYAQTTSLGAPRLYLKFQNSWGTRWGDGGKFYVWADEYRSLLNRGNYAMCTALELAPDPVPTPDEPVVPEIQREYVSLTQLYRWPDRYANSHLVVTDSRTRKRPRWNLDPITTSIPEEEVDHGEEREEGKGRP